MTDGSISLWMGTRADKIISNSIVYEYKQSGCWPGVLVGKIGKNWCQMVVETKTGTTAGSPQHPIFSKLFLESQLTSVD